jgi:hypothetical protein|tara:strand:- start:344 stop:517 length:174 start_codon:yes stop_codon:yes gene_type:complete
MKKIIKVKRHIKSDGSVVESYNRTIDTDDAKTLSFSIKQKRLDKEQASILDSFRKED